MEEVWIKNEPVDVESSAYCEVTCENGISVVKTDPLLATVSLTTEEEYPETVDIKSEITFGDYECTPQNLYVELTKKEKQHSTTGDRRFKCDECGAKFAKNYQLEQHKFTHTGMTLCDSKLS